MQITDERLDEIRARASAATPGPWSWWGNVDTHSVHLRSRFPGDETRDGYLDVMSFRRSGMQGAKPTFNNPRCRMLMIPDSYSLAIYQVAPEATSRHDPNHNVYRGDIIGFRHPDAEFIAAARADVEARMLGWIIETEE